MKTETLEAEAEPVDVGELARVAFDGHRVDLNAWGQLEAVSLGEVLDELVPADEVAARRNGHRDP